MLFLKDCFDYSRSSEFPRRLLNPLVIFNKDILLGFWLELQWLKRLVWEEWTLSNVESSSPYTWYILWGFFIIIITLSFLYLLVLQINGTYHTLTSISLIWLRHFPAHIIKMREREREKIMLARGPSVECKILKKQAFFCNFSFFIFETTLCTTLDT